LALLFTGAETLNDCAAQIIATDADPHLLARANRGCYAPSSLRELPQTWRVAFDHIGEKYCLAQVYRAPARFLEQDIREQLPAGRFDLILCRNLVFTYFQARL
jgi:chemotaxis protein methyltransferase CheR